MRKDYGNIQLIDVANGEETLKENEYYVLMVEDSHGKTLGRKKHEYSDYENGFVGIECNSEHKRYISKKYDDRRVPYRGITFIAEVKNPSLEYIMK